jgi:DNA-binding NarL/FixJ family response regulator
MKTGKPLSVLIVDDSHLIRSRLCALVQEVSRVKVVQLCRDLPEAFQACDTVKPDVAVIDLRLPGGSGKQVLDYVKATLPSCVIIVLTSLVGADIRQSCLDTGADYFFNKATEFERVVEVLASLAE